MAAATVSITLLVLLQKMSPACFWSLFLLLLSGSFVIAWCEQINLKRIRIEEEIKNSKDDDFGFSDDVFATHMRFFTENEPKNNVMLSASLLSKNTASDPNMDASIRPQRQQFDNGDNNNNNEENDNDTSNEPMTTPLSAMYSPVFLVKNTTFTNNNDDITTTAAIMGSENDMATTTTVFSSSSNNNDIYNESKTNSILASEKKDFNWPALGEVNVLLPETILGIPSPDRETIYTPFKDVIIIIPADAWKERRMIMSQQPLTITVLKLPANLSCGPAISLGPAQMTLKLPIVVSLPCNNNSQQKQNIGPFFFSVSENRWIPATSASMGNNNNSNKILQWMQIKQLGIYALLHRSGSNISPPFTNVTLEAVTKKTQQDQRESQATILALVLGCSFSGIVIIAAIKAYDKIRTTTMKILMHHNVDASESNHNDNNNNDSAEAIIISSSTLCFTESNYDNAQAATKIINTNIAAV